MKSKSKLISSILISLGFSFNLFIYGPLEFYFMNMEELWFWIDTFIPIMVGLSLIIFLGLFFLLYKTDGKKNDTIKKLVLMIFVALYIQGNFLTVGYGQFNVAVINWSETIVFGIFNILIWIAIISIPFLIKPIRSGKRLNIFSILLSSFIILIEISTLSVLMVYDYGLIDDKKFYLDNSNIMNMSKDENIIFFMVDSIESKFMTQFLEDYPEYHEKFSDFTFFNNATGAATWTYMSMPTILTGETLEVGKGLRESISDCIEESRLYDALKENGYEIEWYVDSALVPNTEASHIIANKKNEGLKVNTKSKINISSEMFNIVLFKYLPHCLKPFINVQTSNLTKVDSITQNPYFLDDFAIYDVVNSGATANSNTKSFKVIETEGCHYPFNKTANFERDDTDYSEEEVDSRRQTEVVASMKLVETYIEELKKAGVYDNTTIIVAADHGFDNAYNPTIMVKRKNEHHEKLKITSAPISMLEDYLPTLLNTITDSKDYGKDFFDYEEGEERERKVYNYYFSYEQNRGWVECNIVMGNKGDARKKEDYYILEEQFDKCGSMDKTYEFGKQIDFSLGINADMAQSTGILRRPGKDLGVPKGTIIGRDTTINLKVEKASKDVTAKFFVPTIYFDEQHITIRINGEELYQTVLTKEKYIEFTIPKEIWNKQEILNIEINLPDTKPFSTKEHYQKFGTSKVMRSIELKSIEFK